MRLCSLCTFVRFETIWSDQESGKLDISLHNLKKSLDIFSQQIERKRSKEHLVIILAVKESFERFSCLEFICEKSEYQEAGLKQGHPTTIFGKISVRKTIWDLEFSEHLL